MNFEQQHEIPLPYGVVSPYSGNLSVCWLDTRNITFMAVTFGHTVHVGSWEAKTENQVQWNSIVTVDTGTGKSPEITSVGLVHPSCRNQPICVVGTYDMIGFYDTHKKNSRPLFILSLESALKEHGMDVNRDVGTFCKGISCNDNTILVGTHSGDILTFLSQGDSGVSVKRNLREHKGPVVDIATCRYDEVTVSASTDGEVIVWQRPLKGVQSRIQTKQPINAINILRKHILIGTLRGMVQLYSVASGNLMCETRAHARAVTSISVAPESAYVLTASEDTTFTVSKLHTRKPHAFQYEFRCVNAHPNCAIVGAQFTNGRGSNIAIAAYDEPAIYVYKIVKKVQPES